MDLDNAISQLTKSQAAELLAKYQKKPRSKTFVRFPITESRLWGVPRPCTSKEDVMQHFGEAILQNCDKKPTAIIKAQIVEALVTLAEVATTDIMKESLLKEAARFVMIRNRDRLLERVVQYATARPSG